MGLLGKIMGLPDDESGLSFLLSGRGKTPNNYPENSKGRTYEDDKDYSGEYKVCGNCGERGIKGKEPCYRCHSTLR